MFAQITEPLSRGELLRQIPWLGWYVSMSGAPGVAIALMGSALLGWGLLNLRTRNRRVVVIHLGLCWLPVLPGFCAAVVR